MANLRKTGPGLMPTLASYQRPGGVAGPKLTYRMLSAGQMPRRGGYQGLLDEWQGAYQAARGANEARYQDILGGHKALYSRAMANLEGLGAHEAGQIRADYMGGLSRAQQGLVSSGLSGSTIAPGVARGFQRDMTGALGGLNERLRRERIGLDTSLTGTRLGFMERREDEYPDDRMLSSLLLQSGQAAGTSSTGGQTALQRTQARHAKLVDDMMKRARARLR